MDFRRADLGLRGHHMKARGSLAVMANRVSAPDNATLIVGLVLGLGRLWQFLRNRK
jgi:hypothetical protein